MGAIRDTARRLAADAKITAADANELVETAKAQPAATAKKEISEVATKYRDAFDSKGWKALEKAAQAQGISLADESPLSSLSDRPELASIFAGKKMLSSSKSQNDPAVRTVQRALITLARLENKPELALASGADGEFGPQTAKAVKAFQTAHGLTTDGVVGPKTANALHAALVAASKGKPQPQDLNGDGKLTNERFTGDATLEAVAAGSKTLGKGAPKAATTRVQKALVDLGYPLPKYGADGDYGNETAGAVKQFQRDHKLYASGEVDAETLRKLDQVAPAPGKQPVTYPEYGKMFQDGVLTATVGVGYDEDGADLLERKQILDGLKSRGFKKLDVAKLGDKGLIEMGLNPAQVDKQGTYYFNTFIHNGHEVKALVKYVDRDTAAHKSRFAEGFANDDLVLYAGHARYGSGPDFDKKESTKGNFVIGANADGHRDGSLTPAYDAHMRDILKGAGNDLEKTKLKRDYQMMFFSGCTTKNYLDELRSIPAGKNRTNLDIVASNEILYWSNMDQNIFAVLDSVMAGKSSNAMNAKLDKINGEKVGFTFDGFAGNQFQPR